MFNRFLIHSVLRRASLRMAQTLSGKDLSSVIQAQIRDEIAHIKTEFPNFCPGLAIVQVGNREDSNVYIRAKMKTAEDIGIKAVNIRLPNTSTEPELLNQIKKLNEDSTIHGMIVQLPLDCIEPISTNKVLDAILPSKDVDGLHSINAGKLSHGELEDCVLPCTPQGCLGLIKRSGIDIKGKRAVIVGRSKIVGTPMANLLMWNDATSTICHSKTVDLPSVVREADIVVVAIGQPEFVKGDWIKPGAVVIDCGINSIPDSTRKSGYRLVGDVEFEKAKLVASWITPVPGGVGPMTVVMLLSNTLRSAKKVLELKGVVNGKNAQATESD